MVEPLARSAVRFCRAMDTPWLPCDVLPMISTVPPVGPVMVEMMKLPTSRFATTTNNVSPECAMAFVVMEASVLAVVRARSAATLYGVPTAIRRRRC